MATTLIVSDNRGIMLAGWKRGSDFCARVGTKIVVEEGKPAVCNGMLLANFTKATVDKLILAGRVIMR